MSAISGTAGNVRVGGTAGTVVTKVTEWSASMSYNLSDASGMGDTWRDNVPTGPLGVTGTFSAPRDSAGTIQILLSAGVITRTPYVLHLEENTANYIAGTAYINDMGYSTDYNGHAVRTYSFESTGPWTITQA